MVIQLTIKQFISLFLPEHVVQINWFHFAELVQVFIKLLSPRLIIDPVNAGWQVFFINICFYWYCKKAEFAAVVFKVVFPVFQFKPEFFQFLGSKSMSSPCMYPFHYRPETAILLSQ